MLVNVHGSNSILNKEYMVRVESRIQLRDVNFKFSSKFKLGLQKGVYSEISLFKLNS